MNTNKLEQEFAEDLRLVKDPQVPKRGESKMDLWAVWAEATDRGDKVVAERARADLARALPAMREKMKTQLLQEYNYPIDASTVRVAKILRRSFGAELQYYSGPPFELPVAEIMWPSNTHAVHHPKYGALYLIRYDKSHLMAWTAPNRPYTAPSIPPK